MCCFSEYEHAVLEDNTGLVGSAPHAFVRSAIVLVSVTRTFAWHEMEPSRYKKTRLPTSPTNPPIPHPFWYLTYPQISSFFPPDQELCSLLVSEEASPSYELERHASLLHSPFCFLGGWVCDRRTYPTQQAHCSRHLHFDQEVGGSLCQFPSRLHFTIHLILCF